MIEIIAWWCGIYCKSEIYKKNVSKLLAIRTLYELKVNKQRVYRSFWMIHF